MESSQPVTCQIVRASGLCCRCDSRFTDELVVALSDSRVPGGVVFVELRHLTEIAALELRPCAPTSFPKGRAALNCLEFSE
jgi:hypothetical protein